MAEALLTQQIKLLESLLKLEHNKECADCYSKTPRWASISFGTFVCLRCSGVHRNLQVHITKIKSVNLDKWAPEVVEMYKYLNNQMINDYYEAKLPKSFQKPGPNASNNEVEGFIRDKYVNRRWVKSGSEPDPVTLYKTNPKKFLKFIGNMKNGEKESDGEEESSEDEEERQKRKKEKREKREKKKQAKKEAEKAAEQSKASLQAPKQKSTAQVDNMISFGQAKQDDLLGGFDDFQDGNKEMVSFSQSAPDSFTDFQDGTSKQQQPPPQNFDNLFSMYNQPNAQPNKYAALDSMNMSGSTQTYSFNQNQFQPFTQQQQQQQFMNIPQQQQQQFQGNNQFQMNQQQYQQKPQQQFLQTNFNASPLQMQKQSNSWNANQSNNYSGSQQPSMQQTNSVNVYHGGLVNLNNLGGNQSNQFTGSVGFGSFISADQASSQKKQDAFSGLLQWS